MRSIKINYILIVVLFAIVGSSCATDRKESAPNVIIIMADDMGYETVGVNGCTEYSTPNLDRIAENGISFSNCYSQPLCTPSRVKLMTGKYNFRNYEEFEYLNKEEYNFGQLMKDAGYKTCIVGKWQLNGVVSQQPESEDKTRPGKMGFDEFLLWQVTKGKKENGKIYERFSEPYLNDNGVGKRYSKEEYGPDLFCDYAQSFIKKNKDNPFFLYYPMVLTHSPFVPTPDSPEWSSEDTRTKNDTAFYADMVSYADKIVGKIENELKDNGIYENTILIFLGDNGCDNNIYTETDKGTVRGGKWYPIESGIHVPFIASWPAKGIKAKSDDLISFADFMPTLAELVGENIETDGKSFLWALEGKDGERNESILISYDPRWGKGKGSLRCYFALSDGYKLYNDGEFINFKNDPLEKTNLKYESLSVKEKEIYDLLKLELGKVTEWEEQDLPRVKRPKERGSKLKNVN